MARINDPGHNDSIRATSTIPACRNSTGIPPTTGDRAVGNRIHWNIKCSSVTSGTKEPTASQRKNPSETPPSNNETSTRNRRASRAAAAFNRDDHPNNSVRSSRNTSSNGAGARGTCASPSTHAAPHPPGLPPPPQPQCTSSTPRALIPQPHTMPGAHRTKRKQPERSHKRSRVARQTLRAVCHPLCHTVPAHHKPHVLPRPIRVNGIIHHMRVQGVPWNP